MERERASERARGKHTQRQRDSETESQRARAREKERNRNSEKQKAQASARGHLGGRLHLEAIHLGHGPASVLKRCALAPSAVRAQRHERVERR
eukprot:907782-Rhodomonas_salina.1